MMISGKTAARWCAMRCDSRTQQPLKGSFQSFCPLLCILISRQGRPASSSPMTSTNSICCWDSFSVVVSGRAVCTQRLRFPVPAARCPILRDDTESRAHWPHGVPLPVLRSRTCRGRAAPEHSQGLGARISCGYCIAEEAKGGGRAVVRSIRFGKGFGPPKGGADHFVASRLGGRGVGKRAPAHIKARCKSLVLASKGTTKRRK